MRIGYACQTVGVPDTAQKTCILKNCSEDKLTALISHNLNSLENIIEYNYKNGIKLFRISSEIIPFGSSPANTLRWSDIFSSRLSEIGEKIRKYKIRVSTHPGQYSVLNSPDPDVVRRAIEDLNYHALFLDSIGSGTASKMVLHIGGVYGDKKLSLRRFAVNYGYLDQSVKRRLVIENDDRSYNISDVLEIGNSLGIPVVFDNLHNEINPCGTDKKEAFWINECRNTWKEKDGCQKIHYSQQAPHKKVGSHSDSVRINEFLSFFERLDRSDIDIMLEVKDKNLSAVKCINCVSGGKSIKVLEDEWSRYKYKVLENSPDNYIKIRELLQDKKAYPAAEFYNLIEAALGAEIKTGNSINAALHIWGYFNHASADKESKAFFQLIERLQENKISSSAVRKFLWRMAVKYRQEYLLDSYYFVMQ